MTDLPTIPPSLIEAAAMALADKMNHAGWIFRGRYPQYEDSRERWRDRARAVLAAALAECDVREEWMVEVDFGEGFKPRHWVYAREVDRDAHMVAIVNPKRKLYRLVITREERSR